MMNASLDEFCEVLELKIAAEYERRQDALGWRFLSCPKRNLEAAKVAFIGLNPGGSVIDYENDGFSVEAGSAYRIERWGDNAAGEASLQKQVLLLFDLIGVEADDVLSGNFIPFRSPRLGDLQNKKDAFSFGRELWKPILQRDSIELIVAIGGDATRAVSELLGVEHLRKVPSAWGKVSILWGEVDGVNVVGLPHLSTFKLMSRASCISVLNDIFVQIPISSPENHI